MRDHLAFLSSLTLSAVSAVVKQAFFPSSLFFLNFHRHFLLFSGLVSCWQVSITATAAGQWIEQLYKPPACDSLPHQLITYQSPEQQREKIRRTEIYRRMLAIKSLFVFVLCFVFLVSAAPRKFFPVLS